MGTIVWLAPFAGAHSRGVISYLRDRSFDVREWDPAKPPQHMARGVLVVDIADLDDDAGIPWRFADVGIPQFFLVPGGAGIDEWLSRCGVDYFAIKPVSLEAVEQYLRVLLRKSRRLSFEDTRVSVLEDARTVLGDETGAGVREGHVVIDEDTKKVRVAGRDIKLTPKEFELLRLLASRPGRVFSTDEIVANVWKGRGRASSLDVQQYVHHLRKKVERDPGSPRRIRNVKGFGYMYEGEQAG